MNREKEIQEELDKEWGQLDRIERMLKFLCIRARIKDFRAIEKESFMPLHGKGLTRLRRLVANSPDITDILEKK